MIKQIEENNNPYNLEIGKQYWFQYTGCKSEWFSGVVTRFTQFGHPWVEASAGFRHNGIISPGLYNVQEIPPTIKPEEKMVPLSLLEKAFNDARLESPYLSTADKYADFEEWFKQNLK